ncbi:MAG: MnmC family methyltransferase [Nanoarchaeota archaeon]|nr:MnmC family methyltransferase [Nanoarchaeota archaeon]
MKQVTTRDDSITLFNEQYQEHYHSHTIGAIEEAFVKFAEPCKIKDGMKILDVCFGLGYNTLAAISMSKNLEIVGLENDPKILEKTATIEVPERFRKDYEIIRKAAKTLEYHEDGLKIKILVGDARQKIKEAGTNFDAVFLDPFSPKKCPELWTKEFFDEIFKRMNKGAILATYSCATIVRNNLADAGFTVKDGPVFGRKSPATIGIKE